MQSEVSIRSDNAWLSMGRQAHWFTLAYFSREEHGKSTKNTRLPGFFSQAYAREENYAWLYLNPVSFLTLSRTLPAAKCVAYPSRNPFLAKSIVGWTRSFQGNLPYFFQASRNPLTSPGTPEAVGPAVQSATMNNN